MKYLIEEAPVLLTSCEQGFEFAAAAKPAVEVASADEPVRLLHLLLLLLLLLVLLLLALLFQNTLLSFFIRRRAFANQVLT